MERRVRRQEIPKIIFAGETPKGTEKKKINMLYLTVGEISLK